MNRFQLTKEEAAIERDVLKGEYVKVTGRKLADITKMLSARKKDITMTIRVNSEDIHRIKEKASKIGIRYQTFISEVLHEVAAR